MRYFEHTNASGRKAMCELRGCENKIGYPPNISLIPSTFCSFCELEMLLYFCKEHRDIKRLYKPVCESCIPKAEIFPEIDFEYYIVYE